MPLGPIDPSYDWIASALLVSADDASVRLWLYLAWEAGYATGHHAVLDLVPCRQVLNPFQLPLVERT